MFFFTFRPADHVTDSGPSTAAISKFKDSAAEWTASKNIKKNGKRWNLDDIRNNIEVAFHTAWRIRLSQDVPEKQEFAKQMRSIVDALRSNYERKRAHLGRAEVPMEERKERVFLFLQSILAKYESKRMAKNKHYVLSRNLSAEEDFFAPFDRGEQAVFDSLVLDQVGSALNALSLSLSDTHSLSLSLCWTPAQRTKEGRIVARWLLFVRKKRDEVTFEDLADFMAKLAHTFLNRFCVARFCVI